MPDGKLLLIYSNGFGCAPEKGHLGCWLSGFGFQANLFPIYYRQAIASVISRCHSSNSIPNVWLRSPSCHIHPLRQRSGELVLWVVGEWLVTIHWAPWARRLSLAVWIARLDARRPCVSCSYRTVVHNQAIRHWSALSQCILQCESKK